MRKTKIILSITVFTLFYSLSAQGVFERLGKKIVKRAGEQVEQRVETIAEDGVEKTLDNTEAAVKNNIDSGKKEKVQKSGSNPAVSSDKQEKTDLRSFSQYDFVPGDKVLLFDDFSQDATGDFPAMWTTSGSGEVKTLNIAPGNWLHMTTSGNQYQLMRDLDLPDNYIIEFDVILPPTGFNPPALWLVLFKSENEDLGFVEGNPLPKGFGVYMEASDYNGWLGQAYYGNWVEGRSKLSPLQIDKVEHVIVWVQKRRLRVYHAGQKVLDMPTLIPSNFKPDRLIFDNSDCNDSNPYISNLRITTASPDTRNKLLEEGKLISYGIYFDTNSDKIKSESSGTINDIAKTLKGAPGVKIKIVGHTDNVGNDDFNMDLSKRRAEAVKTELVKMGIAADALITDGAGEKSPISSNDTPENRALNRRVEFIKQ